MYYRPRNMYNSETLNENFLRVLLPSNEKSFFYDEK